MNDLIKVQTLNTPTGKYLGFDGVHMRYHYLTTHQDSNYNTMRRNPPGEYYISDADAFCMKYFSKCFFVSSVLAIIAMLELLKALNLL